MKTNKAKKKNRRRIVAAVIAAVLIAAIVLILLRGNRPQVETSAVSTVRSAEVSTGTISTSVSGSGTLTRADGEAVTVPEGVELSEINVEAGDTVSAGDVLAVADSASVLTALSETQEQIETLDTQLAEKEDDTPEDSVSAGVSGRVKKIFAAEGDSVSALIAQQGSLLLLSLDGCMAVSLEASSAVSVGDTVTVTLSDGSTESGTVASNDANLIVTLTDDGPLYGDTVTVTASDGSSLGSGTLYIHSELAVTGYTGTIEAVEVSENDEVSSDTTLFTLTDLGHTAEYDALLAQRQELAQRLQELAALYQDNRVLAPCDGTVTSVSAETTDSSSSSSSSASAQSGSITLPTAAAATASESGAVLTTLAATTESTQLPEALQLPQSSEAPDGSAELTAAELSLTAKITLSGGEISDYAGKFTLSLSGQDEEVQATCDENGEVTFEDLRFTQAGSYTYVLTQVEGTETGVSYDRTRYLLTVNVTEENGVLTASLEKEEDGTEPELVFANQLGAESETPQPSESAALTAPGTGSGETPSTGTSGTSGTSGSSALSGLSGLSGASSGSASSGSGTLTASVTESSDSSAASASSSTSTSTGSTTVLTISPDDTMTVTVSVDELDVLSIQVGQEATVSIDALSSGSVTGTVTRVDTSGSSSGGVTKYSAEITVEKTDEMLASMSASVEIVTEQSENCLTIPEAALQQNGSSTFVYTEYDESTGTLSGETEVTTGVSDGTNVEITEGLSEGTTVYYNYTEASDSSSVMDFSSFSAGEMPSGDFSGGDFSGGDMPSGGGGGDMPSGGGPGGQS